MNPDQARAKVLAKWPNAHIHRWKWRGGLVVIYKPDVMQPLSLHHELGRGFTEAEAWLAAAEQADQSNREPWA